MTEPGREERIQEPGVVGHSYDTDDRLGDLDIYEALINPHDDQGAGQKKSGAGGPMMMPMGGSGSGSSTGTSAGAGTTAAGAAKGTSAASAGAGSGSGFSGTGVSGIGGAGYTPSGLGADSLSGVGGAGLSGLSSSLGTGGLSSSGSSWGAPSFGTGAAGLTAPTLDQLGTAAGTGGFTVPTVPTTPTQTIPTIPVPTVPAPTAPRTNPGGASSPITMPSTGTPSGSGIKVPSSAGGAGMPSVGGGGGASASTANLGVKTVKASPEMLHKEAQHWDDTSKEFTANVSNPIGNQSPSSVDFGMMAAAFDPYNVLLNRLKTWSTEAGAEFSAISDALQSASGGYSDTETTNTATAGQVRTSSNNPV
jgi:hypothetical protein